MKKLIAGNWKMNGNLGQAEELVSSIAAKIQEQPSIIDSYEFLICPPFLYMPAIKDICAKHGIVFGAQDCSVHEAGAYTGEISAQMIADCGGTYVILGHSERRQYHGETSQLVAQKATAAHGAGLVAVICVGETESDRDAGKENEIVGAQLQASLPEGANAENTVIAYEPVWAIGTGKTASSDDVANMHSFICAQLKEQLADSKNLRILYGGSMKPENAHALLSTPHVDGGLIGGASLKAEQFIGIAVAAEEG
ncbi:MAG: triose-phosphate isomerase [Alphaproteobacteria bacterium]|nr:MAG: triose-phosphate isomerase [Alphaproteobacteria bacterium]